MSPETTYTVLLVVQALHLLHHRLVRRHISFVEGAAALLLFLLAATVPLGILTVLAGFSVWLAVAHGVCAAALLATLASLLHRG